MCWFQELMEYAAEYKSAPEVMLNITKRLGSFIHKMDEYCPDEVDELQCDLEMMIYGPHFTETSVEQAVAEMRNEDGTTGPHWTLDETMSVAKAKSIDFAVKKYNIYDWYYSMNMWYSDFYPLHRGEPNRVAEMVILWLEDKDAPEGKSYLYYKAMKKAKEHKYGRM